MTQPSPTIRTYPDGRRLAHLGGRHWRCACGAPLVAECPCCEPPRCRCGR